MAVTEGKVLVAQGGGPTAVINQSLVGVALEARRFPQVVRVYGALYGVQGIVDVGEGESVAAAGLQAEFRTAQLFGILNARPRPGRSCLLPAPC